MNEESQKQKRKKGTITRSTLPQRASYRDYRQDLRVDFWYSCAYCSITEVEAQGIEFQIDHYLPQSKFPALKDDYNNLIYSCSICNRNKSDFSPSTIQEERGYVIIRPDNDDPKEHFDLVEHEIKSKTEKGRFNEAKLQLNRQVLLRIREIRANLHKSSNYIAFGVTELLSLNIDQLPKDYRMLVVNKRNQLKEDFEELNDSIKEYIEKISKSELLDEAQVDVSKNKERKKYLSEVNALGNDYQTSKVRRNKARRKGI